MKGYSYSIEALASRFKSVKENLFEAKPALVLSCVEGILFITITQLPKDEILIQDKIFHIYNNLAGVMIGNYEDICLFRQELIRESIILGDIMYSPKEVSAEILGIHFSKSIKSNFENLLVKPFEVEMIIAQVKDKQERDEIYTISFDGRLKKSLKAGIVGNYKKDDELVKKFEEIKNNHKPNVSYNEILKQIGNPHLNYDKDKLSSNLKWEIKLLKRPVFETTEFDELLIKIKNSD